MSSYYSAENLQRLVREINGRYVDGGASYLFGQFMNRVIKKLEEGRELTPAEVAKIVHIHQSDLSPDEHFPPSAR